MIKDIISNIYDERFLDITTPEEKKKVMGLYKDLKDTINKFWKDHKINRKIK